MFHGSMVALVTPMQASGELDLPALEKLIAFHLKHQTDAIVALGTTGEAATLTKAEKLLVIKTVIAQVAGKIPVIIGTGSNATQETIAATQQAMQLGADACLIVTPYYNKPTQEGLYQHYSAIAKAVPIPQILYNVPSRTGCDLLPETVQRLADIPNIVGLKEATGDLQRLDELRKGCCEKLDLYSGDDATAMEFILRGGKGVISVTANCAPQAMHAMCQAALDGDRERANQWDKKLQPLHHDLFVEANPIPIKWLMAQQGLIAEGIRLPLTPLSFSKQPIVKAAYEACLI